MPKFNPDSQLNIHELTVEEPEKQTPGHDAEPFLTEVFSWIRDKSGYETLVSYILPKWAILLI